MPLDAVQLLGTNDINRHRLGDSQCQYTIICRPDGTVIDDCIVYRLSDGRFIFCTNAREHGRRILDWFRGYDLLQVRR